MSDHAGKYAITFGSFYANGRDVVNWEKDGKRNMSLVFPDRLDALSVLRSMLRQIEEDAWPRRF